MQCIDMEISGYLILLFSQLLHILAISQTETPTEQPPAPCGYSHLNSSELKFNKLKIQFVVPATFQAFSSRLGQMATVSDSTDRQYFHYHQKVCWTTGRPLIKVTVFPLALQTLANYDFDSRIGNACEQILFNEDKHQGADHLCLSCVETHTKVSKWLSLRHMCRRCILLRASEMSTSVVQTDPRCTADPGRPGSERGSFQSPSICTAPFFPHIKLAI